MASAAVYIFRLSRLRLDRLDPEEQSRPELEDRDLNEQTYTMHHLVALLRGVMMIETSVPVWKLVIKREALGRSWDLATQCPHAVGSLNKPLPSLFSR